MNDENKTMKNGRLIQIRGFAGRGSVHWVSVFVYVVYLPRGHFEASRAVYVRRVRSSVGYA
jgi:hypothetical protein